MSIKEALISERDALPGREEPISPGKHAILGNQMAGEQGTLFVPDAHESILFGMGCFWGAERKFWSLPGVYATSVGYAGGYTPNPSYEEVCSGLTGHTEAVAVVYNPAQINLGQLLKVFWLNHDPTQFMRQGNDRGTQYRSAIYCSEEAQLSLSLSTRQAFQQVLDDKSLGEICTEIRVLSDYYFAEAYHQQYLHKNPNGYCGLGGLALGDKDVFDVV